MLDAVRAEAERAYPLECCGLLVGGPGRIDAIRPAANIAADPARRFEVDPAALIAAYKAQRAGGPLLLGCYHSHPGGDPEPSAEDARQAEGGGQFWLVTARDGAATLWRAMGAGALHDRFDPVEMIVD